MRGVWHSAALALAWLLAQPLTAQQAWFAAGGGCLDPVAGAGDLNEYTVREVRIDEPFDHSGYRNALLAALGDRLDQKAGEPFRDAKIAADVEAIQRYLSGMDGPGGLPVSISVVIARVENCEAGSDGEKLDVVYLVYSTDLLLTFEPDGSTCLVPSVSYNRSAGLSAGAVYARRDVGPARQLSFSLGGSSRSRHAEAVLSGSFEPSLSWLRRLDWSAYYSYTGLPTEIGSLQDSRAGGQVSLLAREGSGLRSPGLRAGLAFEGGRMGSRFDLATLPEGVSAASAFTTIRAFAGTIVRGRHQSVSCSYGLQFSLTGTGFRKHLGDVAYQAVFLPALHTPMHLDIRLSGGAIQNLGSVPVAERFFGGNVEQDFLEGDAWRIRGAPLIRSFSQNRFARPGSGAAIGGENFIALNVTFAPTVWKRPLIPRELAGDTQVKAQLDGQLSTAEQTLALDYESRDPAVTRALGMSADLIRLQQAVAGLAAALETVDADDQASYQDRFDDCILTAQNAADQAGMLQGDRLTGSLALDSLVGDGGFVDDILACVADLGPLLGAGAERPAADLQEAQAAIRPVLAQVSPERPATRARQDMAFARRALDMFFDELNIASVAPVFMADAARLGPQPASGGPGFRFAIGGGVRLSLLSCLHLTLGYAFNPGRLSGEERGAIAASLEFDDLF